MTTETETPRTDEIVSDLESGLQSAQEMECNCGSIISEHGCRACSKYSSTISRATKSIAQLETELGEANNSLLNFSNRCEQLFAQLSTLLAENAELKKDKERLDWVQQVVSGEVEPPEDYDDNLIKLSVRQAIDTAIAKGKQE